MKSVARNKANYMIYSLEEYKNLSNKLVNYLNPNSYKNINTFMPGVVQRKGQWSDPEMWHLICVLMEEGHSKKLFTKDGLIGWFSVSRYVSGRSPKSCYDKYRQLLKNDDITKIEDIFNIQDSNKRFNKIIHKAFTPQQEKEMLLEVLHRIDNGELVTVVDISIIARKLFYSLMYLATKVERIGCGFRLE